MNKLKLPHEFFAIKNDGSELFISLLRDERIFPANKLLGNNLGSYYGLYKNIGFVHYGSREYSGWHSDTVFYETPEGFAKEIIALNGKDALPYYDIGETPKMLTVAEELCALWNTAEQTKLFQQWAKANGWVKLAEDEMVVSRKQQSHEGWAQDNDYIKLEPNQQIITWHKQIKYPQENGAISTAGQEFPAHIYRVIKDGYYFHVPTPPAPKKEVVKICIWMTKDGGLAFGQPEHDGISCADPAWKLLKTIETEVEL